MRLFVVESSWQFDFFYVFWLSELGLHPDFDSDKNIFALLRPNF